MKKRTGILIVNLGTPDSPSPKDVHRYLTEFLTDSRVIDLPWLQRQLLVRGIIVPRRYKASAKAYSEIWTSEGSPLLYYSMRLKEALAKELGDDFVVSLGMRYQNPSLKEAVKDLIKAEVNRLIILPLFPQYASATTGSVLQKVMEILSSLQVIPEVTMISDFFDQPELITAFCSAANEHNLDEYDRILFSFHGLPERQLKAACQKEYCLVKPNCCEKITSTNQRCYAAQCHWMAHAIAKQLQLSKERYTICFQSRLGKEPWIQPYTSQVIQEAAKHNEKKLLVFCPSFVCDCLETIYEIGVEYAEEFKAAGGSKLTLVRGLNDHPAWVQSLKKTLLARCSHTANG